MPAGPFHSSGEQQPDSTDREEEEQRGGDHPHSADLSGHPVRYPPTQSAFLVSVPSGLAPATGRERVSDRLEELGEQSEGLTPGLGRPLEGRRKRRVLHDADRVASVLEDRLHASDVGLFLALRDRGGELGRTEQDVADARANESRKVALGCLRHGLPVGLAAFQNEQSETRHSPSSPWPTPPISRRCRSANSSADPGIRTPLVQLDITVGPMLSLVGVAGSRSERQSYRRRIR